MNRLTAHRRRHRILIMVASLAVMAGAAYLTRRVLLLNVARVVLSHDSGLEAQERADSVSISFAPPPPPWIAPMKNQMNDIWKPIGADGVNYYMFAKPRTWFQSYSERSDPLSPYYQAWIGGYVIKLRDGAVPANLESLAWQVTALDQRSWLAAMGDPRPIADASQAAVVGAIAVDGHNLPLWHGSMRSHSDLSAAPTGPRARLIGMPPKSLWPSSLDSFHEVHLDGYFTCWFDPRAKISVVIYAVAASYVGQPVGYNREHISAELLTMMKSARLQAVN